MLGLMWYTVILSYDLMKDIFLKTSNRDCCRDLLPVQSSLDKLPCGAKNIYKMKK